MTLVFEIQIQDPSKFKSAFTKYPHYTKLKDEALIMRLENAKSSFLSEKFQSN